MAKDILIKKKKLRKNIQSFKLHSFILCNRFASTGKNVSGHQLGQTVVQLVSCLGKLVF